MKKIYIKPATQLYSYSLGNAIMQHSLDMGDAKEREVEESDEELEEIDTYQKYSLW